MIRKALILAALFTSSAARAEWHEATSANFVVYSEGTEQDTRDFAAKLERFNYVLRTFMHVTAPQPPNKLRVFLLADSNAVQRIVPGAAGYYDPDARAMMLVGTRAAVSRGNGDLRSSRSEVNDIDPESVLLHEYTHHFTFQYFPATYPIWYSEGFAEFWGSTKLLDNDVVEVGAAAEHRFSTFQELGWLPIDRLMRGRTYGELSGFNLYLLYAEGWLFMRYVFEHPERQRQLDEYLRLVNAGGDFGQAAQRAFPDLATFNNQLFDYASSGRYNVVRLPFRTIDVGPITTRTLRPAEQALIMEEIKVSNGYAQHDAADIAREVQEIAGRFPDDPYALRLIAETQHLAGNGAAASAAADRLLAIEPNNARALTVKGEVQIDALQAAHGTDAAAWAAARAPLAQAIRAAPHDPVALEAYYRSYLAQGVLPPEDAQNALYDAMEMSPSDGEIRYLLAHDFEARHMIPEAIAIIRPEAYSTPARGSETPGERRQREQREQRERQAGREVHETALELLTRLQGQLDEHGRQRQSEAEHPAS